LGHFFFFSRKHLFSPPKILGPGLRRGMLLAKVLSSLVLPIKLERAVVEIAAVEIAAGLQTSKYSFSILLMY
jgi:hypothetical protein